MRTQTYENYWKLTVEYTNIHSDQFINTLSLILDFIDEHNGSYSEDLYKYLQQIVYDKYPKSDFGSTRKSINQFVKLGFINYKLGSYHKYSRDYVKAQTNRRRQYLFSEIFYTNASFDRSVTKQSEKREINFLIKTLEHNCSLTKREIEAMMLIDILSVPKGYADRALLEEYLKLADECDFRVRKYNQVGYLYNFINKLDDVEFVNDKLVFTQNTTDIDEKENTTKRTRDPYLHRLYKLKLKQESLDVFSKSSCMVERLDYPVLIASHIKPFISCSEEEAYDPDNGILLSKNIDSLFDLGYISFNKDGTIICSETLSNEVKEHLKKYSLTSTFLTTQRLKYLDYHLANVFRT